MRRLRSKAAASARKFEAKNESSNNLGKDVMAECNVDVNVDVVDMEKKEKKQQRQQAPVVPKQAIPKASSPSSPSSTTSSDEKEEKQDQQEMQPIPAHHVKKGMIVMLNGYPCKVGEVKISKTGKHGHTKCRITGVCVITSLKQVVVKPSHINLLLPVVIKDEYQLSYITADGLLCLLDQHNKMFTVDVPDSKQKASLLEAKAADTESEKDFFVTTIQAPISVTGKIVVELSITNWKLGNAAK